MGEIAAPASAVPARRRGWPLFLLGVLLCALGPLSYFALLKLGVLFTPWHVPILGTVGVLALILWIRQRPGWPRIAGTIPFALFCCFEWFLLLVAFRTPIYTGPASPEKELPSFATTLASGQSLTSKDLANGSRTALVFFRGRW